MMRFLFSLISAITLLSAMAAAPSGSLPVIYINTEGNAPVTSKEDYLSATYYLVNGDASIGSPTEPLTTQIKGRGNYTWTGFNKKPYRLKLDSKQPLLGLKKSKHFGLLAGADDNLGFLRNTVGYEVSRRLGMDWTPSHEPVELVLNGEYLGLYFLTELIRVDADRVAVTEQPDGATDPDAVTGGWLVEIDNYNDPCQISIREHCGTGEFMRFTHKSPEALSTEQRNYLVDLVTAADAAIYDSDKSSSSWLDYFDLDELVKFYITQEITDNGESFHGSCYWHKERGSDSKMRFGPVWDFGNSFRRSSNDFIYGNTFFHQHWIGEIAKFPAFQEAVKAKWAEFKPQIAEIEAYISDFATKIASAAVADAQRWPEYGNADMAKAKNRYLDFFRSKVSWLNSQWDDGDTPSYFSHLYMVGASSVLGNWQPASAPELYYDAQSQSYHRHFDRISKLNEGRGFKIIDRRSWEGCFEMCGNGSLLNLNEDYVVSTVVHDPNIGLAEAEIFNVDVDVRQVGDDWVLRISDGSGVEPAVRDAISILGARGCITASTSYPTHLSIITASGSCAASLIIDGTTQVPLAPGFYIVKADSITHKIVVK